VSDTLASDDDEATLRGDHLEVLSDANKDLRFLQGSFCCFHGASSVNPLSALCFSFFKDDDNVDVNFFVPKRLWPCRLPASVLFISMLSRTDSMPGFDAFGSDADHLRSSPPVDNFAFRSMARFTLLIDAAVWAVLSDFERDE